MNELHGNYFKKPNLFFSVQVQSMNVIKPSVPIITNVSCYNTGKIYVEWTKPLRHSGLKSEKKYPHFARYLLDNAPNFVVGCIIQKIS